MNCLIVFLILYSYIQQAQCPENEFLLSKSSLDCDFISQSTYIWCKSVYHFRKQKTCPLRIETKDLKQLTLSLLLILGGQVELNPGPKAKYPCQVCNKAVKWGQRGIACDNCDLWFHQACMSMNTDSYQRLANSSLAWLCKGCNTPNHRSVIYQSIQSDDNLVH